MKFFDQWFYRKARWAWKRAGYQYPELRLEQDLLDRRAQDLYRDNELEVVTGRAIAEDPAHTSDGMHIDIRHLLGGYVVTVRVDKNKQSQGNYISTEPERTSYIITDDQDFDQELCKILAMERLKR